MSVVCPVATLQNLRGLTNGGPMRDMMLLVEPMIPGLRRYARALMRDTSDADDLVQDCLERAVSRWHQRREDGSLRGWMYAILHNLAMNRLNQRSRRGEHVPVDSVPERTLVQEATQESAVHGRDIVQAVGRLPENQKAVLLLISVEDLSYAEAADVLDIPIGTVMSRLSRARARLRDDMDGTGQAAASHLRRVK